MFDIKYYYKKQPEKSLKSPDVAVLLNALNCINLAVNSSTKMKGINKHLIRDKSRRDTKCFKK